MKDKTIRRNYKSRMDAKQDIWRSQPALMGDGKGTIEVPGQPGYVYIRLGGGDLGQAFNNRCPLADNLAIEVGYDPVTDPDRRIFQVLNVRMADYAMGGNANVYPNVANHHTSHEFGGGDDVYVNWRRLMGFRVGRPSGFVVTIDSGVIFRAGAWTTLATQTIDLTALKPAGLQVRYVLITLNAAGVATATAGVAAVGANITSTPVPPAGHIPLASVRLYGTQTAIGDTPTAPDIFDLRFPTYAGAAGGAPGGVNTNVQFNDSGAFGGDTGFTWNKTTEVVTVSQTTNVGAAVFAGVGLNDMTTSGIDTSISDNFTILIEIDAEGAPDTFRGSYDGGATWAWSGEPIAGPLDVWYGATITFAANTGHTLGDQWSFTINQYAPITVLRPGVVTQGIRIWDHGIVGVADADEQELTLSGGNGSGATPGQSVTIYGGTGGPTGGAGGGILVTAGSSLTGGDGGGSISFTAGTGEDTGAGGNIQFNAGNGGSVSGAGGQFSIYGGNAQGGDSNGGGFTISAGNATGAGTAGIIQITSGAAGTDGDGGGISFFCGAAGTNTGNGGDIDFTASAAQAGTGGDGGSLTFYAGLKDGGGADGEINFYPPKNVNIGNGAAGIDYTLTFVGETNSGLITWLEDEDQFKFDDRLQTDGGRIGKITDATDTYTILVSDETVVCNKATAFTVTMPTAVLGQMFVIKNIGAGNVTVTAPGVDTFDEVDADLVLSQYDCIKLQCRAANKWIKIT